MNPHRLPVPTPDEALLAESKAKISRYVAPGPEDSFQLEAAEELVERYERQTADRRGAVDLLVHCLESGNQAIDVYGDLFEEFYSTMIEIAHRCAGLVEADDDLLQEFRPRLHAVPDDPGSQAGGGQCCRARAGQLRRAPTTATGCSLDARSHARRGGRL